MTAIVRDLKIEQGATYVFAFTWSDGVDDGEGNIIAGDPKDLTGCEVRMQIRKAQQSAALLNATTVNGKIILGLPKGSRPGDTTDETNGRITVWLTDEDTDVLSEKSAKYDLELEDANEDVFRLLKGTVTVDPNYTQETEDPVVNA